MAATKTKISLEKRREMQKKGAKTKANTLSLKEKAFSVDVVKTRNGTKSAKKIYNTKNDNVAAAIASENLRKPKIREEINRLLVDNNIQMEEILSTHKRNMIQDKHLPTSQKAVKDFYDILGMTNQEAPQSSTQIAFIINE